MRTRTCMYTRCFRYLDKETRGLICVCVADYMFDEWSDRMWCCIYLFWMFNLRICWKDKSVMLCRVLVMVWIICRHMYSSWWIVVESRSPGRVRRFCCWWKVVPDCMRLHMFGESFLICITELFPLVIGKCLVAK